MHDERFDLWVQVGVLQGIRRQCKRAGTPVPLDVTCTLRQVLIDIRRLNRQERGKKSVG